MKFILVISFALITSFVSAQDEFWTSISFKGKLIKKVKYELNSGYRNDFILTNPSYLVSSAIVFKLDKKLHLGIDYRYTNEVKKMFRFINENRISIYLNKKIKLKPFTLDFKSLSQFEMKNRIKVEDELLNFLWRNELKIETKLFDFIDVFSAGEVFLFDHESIISKYRLEFGVDKKFYKKVKIKISYLMDSNRLSYFELMEFKHVLKTGITIDIN